MPIDPNEFWPQLEKLGEDEVRLKLAQGVYGTRKRAPVDEWLRRKEQARQNKIANKHAKWSKWQSIAAIVVAVAALVTIVLSLIGIET